MSSSSSSHLGKREREQKQEEDDYMDSEDLDIEEALHVQKMARRREGNGVKLSYADLKDYAATWKNTTHEQWLIVDASLRYYGYRLHMRLKTVWQNHDVEYRAQLTSYFVGRTSEKVYRMPDGLRPCDANKPGNYVPTFTMGVLLAKTAKERKIRQRTDWLIGATFDANRSENTQRKLQVMLDAMAAARTPKEFSTAKRMKVFQPVSSLLRFKRHQLSAFRDLSGLVFEFAGI